MTKGKSEKLVDIKLRETRNQSAQKTNKNKQKTLWKNPHLTELDIKKKKICDPFILFCFY